MRVFVVAIGGFVFIVLLAALGCLLVMEGEFVLWLTAFGELAIAFVIYYEIHTNRTAAFLAEAQSEDSSKKRALLYDTYARLPDAPTLKKRAEEFTKRIWSCTQLREACDLQWTYFCRLGYIDRHLAIKWFPQVIVAFWFMTAIYNRDHQKLRAASVKDSGTKLVRASLRVMKRRNKPLTIYSNDRTALVVIPVAEFKRMLRSMNEPFKS
jgi:hypothetical protein